MHIWFYTWDGLPSASLLHALYPTLSHDERERHGRFHFEKDRHIYLLAHVLLRRALSQYEDIPEVSWEFAIGSHGKPYLASLVHDPLCFNLTHTAGLVACAISRHAELGLDAERIDRPCDFLEIARSVFAPAELRSLDDAPESGRPELFFTYWTLKEAYVKARGAGLSLPLQDFAIRLDPGGAGIEFLGAGEGGPDEWRLRVFRPTPHHVLAAAMRMSGTAEFQIHDGAGLINLKPLPNIRQLHQAGGLPP